MKRRMLLAVLLLAVLLPCCAWAESMRLPVRVRATGEVPATPETFELILTAEDEVTPMPDGHLGGVYSLDLKGGSSGSFPPIHYQRAGRYEYTLHQLPGEDPTCRYDRRRFLIQVSVFDTPDGQECVIVVKENAQGAKLAEIAFENEYGAVTPTPTKAPDKTPVPDIPEYATPTPIPETTPNPRPTPTRDPSLPPTGVEDRWMYYLGGAAVLLMIAGVMLRVILRKETDGDE